MADLTVERLAGWLQELRIPEGMAHRVLSEDQSRWVAEQLLPRIQGTGPIVTVVRDEQHGNFSIHQEHIDPPTLPRPPS